MWILHRLWFNQPQREHEGRGLPRHWHTHTNTHFPVTCTWKCTHIKVNTLQNVCAAHTKQTHEVRLQAPRIMFRRGHKQTARTSRAHAHTHLRCGEADSGWTEGCRQVKDEVLQRRWEVHTDSGDWWSLSLSSVGSSEPPSASRSHVSPSRSLSACPSPTLLPKSDVSSLLLNTELLFSYQRETRRSMHTSSCFTLDQWKQRGTKYVIRYLACVKKYDVL